MGIAAFETGLTVVYDRENRELGVLYKERSSRLERLKIGLD